MVNSNKTINILHAVYLVNNQLIAIDGTNSCLTRGVTENEVIHVVIKSPIRV